MKLILGFKYKGRYKFEQCTYILMDENYATGIFRITTILYKYIEEQADDEENGKFLKSEKMLEKTSDKIYGDIVRVKRITRSNLNEIFCKARRN